MLHFEDKEERERETEQVHPHQPFFFFFFANLIHQASSNPTQNPQNRAQINAIAKPKP